MSNNLGLDHKIAQPVFENCGCGFVSQVLVLVVKCLQRKDSLYATALHIARQQQRMRQQHNIAAQSKTGTNSRQVTVKKETSSSKRSATGSRTGAIDSTIVAAPGSNLALAAAGLFDILNLIQPLVVEAANACEYLPRVRRACGLLNCSTDCRSTLAHVSCGIRFQ
mgnify:CR=1 FL=1